MTINSGSDKFQSLGVLAHIGQPEYKAGVESGVRMGRAGVRRALCVNQESGNSGLDERCRGFAAGLRRFGGRSRQLPIPLQDPARAQTEMATAVTDGPVDGILTLGPGGAKPAIDAVRASGLESRVKLATFDLSPEVLTAVRDGDMLFAVDQQPYLQGFLPVILLAEQARHQVFPGRGELIPTGPAVRDRRERGRRDPAQRRGGPLIGAASRGSASAGRSDRAPSSRPRRPPLTWIRSWASALSSITVASCFFCPSGLMPPAT